MMVSDATQQLKQSIGNANTITLFLPETAGRDAILSALAWQKLLETQKKTVTVYASSLHVNEYKEFDAVSTFKTRLPGRRTIVKVKLNGSGISKINYEVKGAELLLYLTPNNGQIQSDDVSVTGELLKTDLVITLGVTDPAKVGRWSSDWPRQMLDGVTLINIDSSSDNTQYGQINVVDPQRHSLSELSAKIFQELGWEIGEEVSTFLYHGLVSGSEHFSTQVSPELFELAAYLLRHGAQITIDKPQENSAQEPSKTPGDQVQKDK